MDSIYTGVPLLEWDDPVFWALTIGADGNSPDAQDALRLCPEIIYALKYGTVGDARPLLQRIDDLMAQFYEYGYLPRPAAPENGLEEGWVSAMDAPILAFAAYLAYEKVGEEKYQQYVEDLIPYLVAPTTEHGYVLKLSEDAWWPLEYAWTDVTEETAWYVLNGSLFGMVALQALAILTEDTRLTELCEKAATAYALKLDGFDYPNGQWCYYELLSSSGVKNPNRQQKLLIEIRALEALFHMTGKEVYQDAYQRRQGMLKANLPVYATENEDGTVTVSLLRAAAPHPYLIDIYPTVLELLDQDGSVVETLYANSKYYMDNWILEDVPATVTSYRLYSQCNVKELGPYFLFEGPIQYLEPEEAAVPEPLSGTWRASNDAVLLDQQTLTLDLDASELPRGNTVYAIDGNAIAQGPETYWVFELENLGSETISMGATLYDDNGTAIVRTLSPLPPGKYFVLFSHLGFRYNDLDLGDVSMVGLTYYDSNLSEDCQIKLGNVYALENTRQVINYWKDTPCQFWYESLP